MIVDLIRNDLGRLALPGSVQVQGLCRVEAYPTVFQMVSDVTAILPQVSLYEIFRALFPCGSITGAPKVRAMEIIRELEPNPRGLYTGTLGWIAPSGDLSLNVAIRTLVLDTAGQGRLGVGAGIVSDSEPEAERLECWAKARFLTDLPPTLQLIETLRLEAGSDDPFPLLARHLQRLAVSSALLGFIYDLPGVRRELLNHAAGHLPGNYRTRLLLSPDGKVEISSQPLPEAGNKCWRVVFAQRRLDSACWLSRHKTTARSAYDQDLARLPEDVFDLLYFNERGELCEGARSNVYLRLQGRLFTPPLACGVLDGVMRRKLLDEGLVEERVLYRQDVLEADSLYLSNALRGLFQVFPLFGKEFTV